MATYLSLADQYMILLAIDLLFTILAFGLRRIEAFMIAWITWWISSGIHLFVSQPTGAFWTMGLLYFGFGTIFLVMTIVKAFSMIREATQTKKSQNSDVSYV